MSRERERRATAGGDSTEHIDVRAVVVIASEASREALRRALSDWASSFGVEVLPGARDNDHVGIFVETRRLDVVVTAPPEAGALFEPAGPVAVVLLEHGDRQLDEFPDRVVDALEQLEGATVRDAFRAPILLIGSGRSPVRAETQVLNASRFLRSRRVRRDDPDELIAGVDWMFTELGCRAWLRTGNSWPDTVARLRLEGRFAVARLARSVQPVARVFDRDRRSAARSVLVYLVLAFAALGSVLVFRQLSEAQARAEAERTRAVTKIEWALHAEEDTEARRLFDALDVGDELKAGLLVSRANQIFQRGWDGTTDRRDGWLVGVGMFELAASKGHPTAWHKCGDAWYAVARDAYSAGERAWSAVCLERAVAALESAVRRYEELGRQGDAGRAGRRLLLCQRELDGLLPDRPDDTGSG